ncbi:uncharacterized protein LOC133716285 [Rosa rugosa]|uniref:uncharacterized protein LOC133716285 n=1 Tax=Rosa rugosa TaxID=74645 RepID=UPI002B40199F|nr:uncharacterized protein LOC133716285 [Rosa rugosa]
MEKSRQEKRKEARLAKNARKNESWLLRQAYAHFASIYLTRAQKLNSSKSTDSSVQNLKDKTVTQLDGNSERSRNMNKTNMGVETEVENTKSEAPEHSYPKPLKAVGGDKVSKRTPKTKFEKFLELDNTRADEDLELERKLKVKGGKLKGEDLGLNMLFEGISSLADSLGNKEVTYPEALASKRSPRKKRKKEKLLPDDLKGEDPKVVATDGAEVESSDFPSKSSSRKRQKKRKSLEETKEGNKGGDMDIKVSKPMDSYGTDIVLEKVPAKTPKKYVAPHLRSRAGNELEEHSQVRRQLRGLLNRLSESNVESITGEVSVLMRSIPRGIASQIFGHEEVLASCAHGPRGNEQHAAVFAAFVADMASSVGIDFGAKLLALLAKTFEDEYHKEDNISLRNVTLLLSQLCIFGVCSR